jgi:protein TonB
MNRHRIHGIARAALAALVAGLCLAGPSCQREQPQRHPPEAPSPQQGSQEIPESTSEVPEIPIDVMPKVLQAAPVAYPEEARSRGEEGIVYIKARVGTDGKVIEASVDSAQPSSPLLAEAALDAIRRYTFEPARAKGEPVAVWVVVPVRFRLH